MMEENSSDAMAHQAAKGDRHAQEELLASFRIQLRRMIEVRLDRRLAGRTDASDIVQETLTAALLRLPEYFADPKISFYPWLRRIAADRMADAYRKHVSADRRSVLKENPGYQNLNDDSSVVVPMALTATGAGPAEVAETDELHTRALAALNELKAQDREILVLRYLEQLDVQEIANALEISETAVTSRHLRALERLRKLIKD